MTEPRVRAYWTADGDLIRFVSLGAGKLACSLCGRSGYPPIPDPLRVGKNHWTRRCLSGHPVACRTCRRRFTSSSGLSAHIQPRRPGSRSLPCPRTLCTPGVHP